jgi:4-alpha-glucanotransferase
VPPRISLALAIHNHQPVGNFGWVYAEVFERAYEPMVAALERHPAVRLALHYTGPLLEWMRAERPEFIERLRCLVERGQVELLGGGYYEPVLASLPERDRIGQLRRMGDELEALTGTRPLGAWLAERVWEPSLPSALVPAGYRWTILDDNHFRAASIADDAMWGAYVTEDQGNLLTIFGTEHGLRLLIPFREVDEVIDHLRDHATEDGRRLGMMGDDGEKFGAWPTTWEHCWGKGRWVDRFFEAIEANADWLTTVTPSAWLDRQGPIGRVYIPASSYLEMGEWVLPPNEAAIFSPILHAAIDDDRPEARWLRGGFWRNFQVRYREVNDLHKQMLRTSAKVDGMPPGAARDLAVDHLYRGQSNDCYWHGLFGGIYISHMRLATFEHLIAAEDLADAVAGSDRASCVIDLDLDGRDEVLFLHPGQLVAVDVEEGAGIGSWDIRAARHALTAVMRRRPEAYHAKLLARDVPAPVTGAGPSRPADIEAVESIHELVRSKEADLAEHLVYDAYERRSGLVRCLPLDTGAADFAAGRARELGDFVDGPFRLANLEPDRLVVTRDGSIETARVRAPVRVEKTLTLGGGRGDPWLGLEVMVENRSRLDLEFRLGVEFAITMLGGGGNPAAWWRVGDERTRHDAAGSAAGISTVAQGNDHLGLRLKTSVDRALDAWWSPIDTISNSEGGFERVYQGSCLLLSLPVALAPGGRESLSVRTSVSASRDRALEEVSATTSST